MSVAERVLMYRNCARVERRLREATTAEIQAAVRLAMSI